MRFEKMNKILLLILSILFGTYTSFGQLQQNVEIEIVGMPSWQLLIPMQADGLILFIKTDQTKAKVIHMDKNLVKIWEKDIFLDVERAPTAYTFDADNATFLFRETSGMYYQLFKFNLKSGEYSNKGFELREYFQDQDYVFLKNKLIMAGASEKGGAFYEYNFETEKGKLIDNGIIGNVRVQEFKYNPENKKIESLWAVKTIGYSNEKRKKGAYTKEAFLSYVDFDTLGIKIFQKDLKQKNGNFPMDGKMLRINGNKAVIGTFQDIKGEKGIFYNDLNGSITADFKTFTYSELLKGNPEIPAADIKRLVKDYTFLMNEPVKNNDGLVVGGVFFKAEFKNVSEQVYDPYGNQNNGSRYGNNSSIFGRNSTRSQTKRVFLGYNYPLGFVLNLDETGNNISSNRIDINQVSPQIKPAISYNSSGAVAFCVKGNLAAKNFNIGTKPILYKLSNDETAQTKNQNYIPQYQEVQNWYDNYFIANGSKNKLEVLKIENTSEVSKTKRKRNRNNVPSFTQVRKTIYLTKIASGE
jgi:hypothetical protein